MSSNPTAAPKALRYTGDGSLFVRDVPATDLTETDIARLGPVLVNSAEVSGLYERVSVADAKTINAAGDPGVEGAGAPQGDVSTSGPDAGKAS